MTVNELLLEKAMTQYRLSKISGIAYATINDICSGKTQIGKCSAETLYKIATALGVAMEVFFEKSIVQETPRERSYEYGLPTYLQHDLDAYKQAIKDGSTLLDCLWGELYGSINMAEVSDGVITPEHADYLRNKYLWR